MKLPSLQDAKKVLKKYKDNERNNLHSDNFVLLAQTFQDEKALISAQKNVDEQKRKGYIEFDCPFNDDAYLSCNHYHRQLEKICKS